MLENKTGFWGYQEARDLVGFRKQRPEALEIVLELRGHTQFEARAGVAPTSPKPQPCKAL
jgi:hypothetical protein